MAYTQSGWSPFTKKKKKEYEPQTKTRGYKDPTKKGHHTHPDMIPQTERQKMSVGRLEGEMWGVMDNELFEARERGDKSAIKRYEKRISNLRKEIKYKKKK